MYELNYPRRQGKTEFRLFALDKPALTIIFDINLHRVYILHKQSGEQINKRCYMSHQEKYSS